MPYGIKGPQTAWSSPDNTSKQRKHLSLINLHRLMELTSGVPEVVVGLVDGPVDAQHPDLQAANIIEIPRVVNGWRDSKGLAAVHGTFVAGVLCAKRTSTAAPGICPGCTLVNRPVFSDAGANSKAGSQLTAALAELADAIVECVDAGAHVINVSASVINPMEWSGRRLDQALDYAMKRASLIVAAAGNYGTVASTIMTRHHWVIPVVAFGLNGRPLGMSNISASVGRLGVGAPGEHVAGLKPGGGTVSWTGTSAATPLATGTLALLRSLLPDVTSAALRQAVNEAARRRRSLVPPLMNAWSIYSALRSGMSHM